MGNLKSVFTGVYLHYDKPELEESTAERTKLRKQRLKEIVEKEKMINTRLFEE